MKFKNIIKSIKELDILQSIVIGLMIIGSIFMMIYACLSLDIVYSNIPEQVKDIPSLTTFTLSFKEVTPIMLGDNINLILNFTNLYTIKLEQYMNYKIGGYTTNISEEEIMKLIGEINA